MAILEKGTNNYFKVNPEQSFVQNNMLFVNFTVYGSEIDRINEKQRLEEFNAFDANCKRLLEEWSVNEQYADLCKDFSQAAETIKDKRYINGIPAFSDCELSEEIARLLTDCGYRSEWIDQPIHIVSKRIVNCGIWKEEPLTSQYVYDKLKAKMSRDILDI